MTLLPLIDREMRTAARQPFTYYLRVLGLASALLVTIWCGLAGGFVNGQGGVVFSGLHSVLTLAIWILVPFMSADCISRERREGTLGLLFMTGLKGGEIVTAKGLAHGLRAVSLWLAMLPVLTLPVLLGGVSYLQAGVAALDDCNALCLALAAGLLASACSKSWMQACILAVGLAVVFAHALVMANLWSAWSARVAMAPQLFNLLPLFSLLGVDWFSPGSMPIATIGSRSPAATGWQLLFSRAEVSLGALALLVLAVIFAGTRSRRSWQDQPPSARRLWLTKTFCTPIVWKSFFRRWLERKLNRNPIGWLEQRTWSGRLVTWGWFAVVVSLFSAAFSDRNFLRDFGFWLRLVGLSLVGSMAFTAAGSFRRERESGVMELLLVSPLQESQILFGRLRGLWGQFLPSLGLMLFIWMYFLTFLPAHDDLLWIVFYASSFLTQPIIGLYYSLRCRNFLAAFLAGVAVGGVAPMLLGEIVSWYLELVTPYPGPSSPLGAFCLVLLVQLFFAGLCGWRLYERMRRRDFPLQSAQK